MRIAKSTFAGASLGAVAIVGSTLAAVWLSGHFEAFAQDRGLLQLFVAIPLASLLAAALLAFLGLLTPGQMLWAMVPVEGLILLGVGVLGPGLGGWPWALVISGVVFVPWVVGLAIGRSLGRRPAPGE